MTAQLSGHLALTIDTVVLTVVAHGNAHYSIELDTGHMPDTALNFKLQNYIFVS